MPLKTSKLCKRFPEVMKDTSSLSILEYFIQYMEYRDAIHLVQFWLTVESFKPSARTPRTPILTDRRSPKLYPSPVDTGSTDRSSWHSRASWTSDDVIVGSPVNSRGVVGEIENTSETAGVGGRDRDSPGQGPGSHRDGPGQGSHRDSPGSHRHKVLERRDTENYRYCNCNLGMHHRATPPPTHRQQDSPHEHLTGHGEEPDHGILGPHKEDCKYGAHRHHQIRTTHPYSTNIMLETDALGLYSKYLALNALKPVGVSDEIRQKVEVSICPEDGKIDSSCFDEAQEFVYSAMEKRYYPGFLQSAFLCKYQLDYIASGALNLIDFLLGDNALFYFMEFMEQERASSLLQFWLTAENFYNELSSPAHIPDVETDTTDAMAIYDRYFSLQASEPLKMEDSVRLDVENRICDEHGPRPDSYLRPQLVAFHTMNEVYYPTFIGSSIYLRFLNELVQMLNKENERNQANGDPTLTTSKAHDEGSSSSAMLKLGHVIMGKDLDDPNSLWERPALLFRLGHVNEFGEYISEIEPLPIKATKKEYSWSVSAKNLRKRRNQEDLAMKIAKNIIREVTNCVITS